MKTFKTYRTVLQFYTFLLFYFFLSLSRSATGQANIPTFEKYTTDNGMSQDFINAIAQDSLGFLWIGTNDGLNKFDGYTFEIYTSNGPPNRSLTSNQINSLAVGKNNQLWIGTNSGLNCLNMKAGTIKKFSFKTPSNTNVSVPKVLTDSRGRVWFNYEFDTYINCYDPSTQKLRNIPLNGYEPGMRALPIDYIMLKSGKIMIGSAKGQLITINPENFKIESSYLIDSTFEMNQLYEDNHGIIWASSNSKGFYTIDLHSIDSTEPNKSPYYYYFAAKSFVQPNDTTMWIGSHREGVFMLNQQKNTATQFYMDKTGLNLPNRAGVSCFFKDRSNNIWIGSTGYGLFVHSQDSKPFQTITQSHLPVRSIKKLPAITLNTFANDNGFNCMTMKSLRGIYADRNFIWMGGYLGFNKLNRQTNKITIIDTIIIPYTIVPDIHKKDILWIGGEIPGNSMLKYNKKNDKLTVEPVTCGFIYSLLCDNSGKLWIGTQRNLILYDPVTHSKRIFDNPKGSKQNVPQGSVKSLAIDNDGLIWIGTSLGLLATYNPVNDEFKYYNDKEGSENEFAKDYILSILIQDNIIWVGTGSGLYRLDKKTGLTEIFTMRDGLPNDVIYAIIADNDSNLWLSTNKGISMFNYAKKQFLNYDKTDGIQANEFNTSSHFKSEQGEIFLGGVNGLTYFEPSLILKNQFNVNIILSNLSISGRTPDTIIKCAYLKQIELTHKDKFIHLEFAAVNLIQAHRTKYRYKLEGLSDHWVDLGTERWVMFNNLSPGEYTLIVTAFNGDNVQSPVPLRLSIIVHPPFWLRWWFTAGILCLITAVIWLAIVYRFGSIKRHNIELARLVEVRTSRIKEQNEEIIAQKEQLELSNQNLEVLNATKDKFFSIIGHDLKNPFGVVMGFSELMITEFDQLSDDLKQQYLKIINDASTSGYNLLENLLSWSRTQTGKIAFDPATNHLSPIIFDEIGKAGTLATAKDIRVIPNVPGENSGYFDENMFRTVLRNLLMNAIKFTNNRGVIEVSVKPVGNFYEIAVSDTGTGMDPEVLSNLFSLDVNHTRPGTNNEKGTGLGLILCQEFVKRNGGSLTVESQPGFGSTFRFTVLKEKDFTLV